MLLEPEIGIKNQNTLLRRKGDRCLLTSDNFLDFIPQSALLRVIGKGIACGFTFFL
jgi:hypothetical protein